MYNIMAEERCGFLVSDTRLLLWKYEMEMLCWLNEICDKYDIQYFLIGGSEIGAIRHKGFIPWDDDIDIGMMRKDFDKLLSVYKQELLAEYDLQYRFCGNGSVWSNLCRIRDKRTTGIIDNQAGKDIAHGVFIEIYPYDNLPNNRVAQKKMAKKVNNLIIILQDKIGQKACTGFRMKILKKIYTFKSPSQIDQMIENCCKKYNNMNTKYVGTLMTPSYVKSGTEVLERHCVEKTIIVPFENITARVPKGYDECLMKQYGDYMKLPPEVDRGKHHSDKVFYDPLHPYTKYGSMCVDELFDKYGFLL